MRCFMIYELSVSSPRIVGLKQTKGDGLWMTYLIFQYPRLGSLG